MPKKIKKKKSFSVSWKYVIATVMIILALIFVIVQLGFDKFIWDRTAENGSLKVTLLIQSALEGLEEIKSSPTEGPGKSQLINETRLMLPAETDSVKRLLYYYSASDIGTDGTGYTWDTPETVQVTTKQIAMLSRQRIMTGQTINDVFGLVPEAQACNRGFTLQFSESKDNGLILSGTTKLRDGRVLYVYREPECKTFDTGINELEAYLLQAQSY